MENRNLNSELKHEGAASYRTDEWD